MFIKNPNQKVSYSFRINPELLEKLKEYAKATNQSLPETLNTLLEESIDGINTSNTFVNELDGIIINIPLMYHIQKVKTIADTTENITLFEKGTSNYLDYETEGLTYEVKQIPNNLDTWSKTTGYGCTETGVLHKGVNLVIVPELILNPDLYITEKSITNCLKFLYFQVDTNNKTQVTSISYKDCFRRLKEAGNEEVLYKFRAIDSTIYKFALSYMAELEKDPEAYTRYDSYRVNIYDYLVKYAQKYNDGTIVNLEELPVLDSEDDNEETTETKGGLKFTNKPVVFTTDSILTEILEENQALQNRVTELENIFKELYNMLNDSEEREKAWDELKKNQ